MSKESEGKKQISSATAEKIITNLVLIAVGVLFCMNKVTAFVNYALGIALCLFGAIRIVLAATKGHSLFSAEGVIDGVIIALGITCLVEMPLLVFVQVVPYVLCSVGAVFIAEAFIAKFARKDLKLVYFILELAIGVICLVVGLCLIFIEKFRSIQSMIFGVCLIAFALFRLVQMILKK